MSVSIRTDIKIDPDAKVSDDEMVCAACGNIVPAERLTAWQFDIGSCGKEDCTGQIVADMVVELTNQREALSRFRHSWRLFHSALTAVLANTQRCGEHSTLEELVQTVEFIRGLAFRALNPAEES